MATSNISNAKLFVYASLCVRVFHDHRVPEHQFFVVTPTHLAANRSDVVFLPASPLTDYMGVL